MYEQDPTYAPIEAFVDELVRAGVAHACVSPGARSTPLALTIANHAGLHAWSHIDERSGAFFGLGMAKATRNPVAIVCTSGTAAANFLPAIIEATYGHVPLIVLTADRPPELRDCGAGQTIDQIKLYGTNVKWFAEAGLPETGESYFRSLARRAYAAASANPAGPVHVNFPFREPLVPRDKSSAPANQTTLRVQVPSTTVHEADRTPAPETLSALEKLVGAAPRGLIVCGPYDGDDRFARAVSLFAARAAYPILADPLSQVRSGTHDTSTILGHYDAFLRHERFAAGMKPDVILRCGALPTSKPFLQYVERHSGCRQVVIDPLGFWRDPTLSANDFVRADPTLLFESLAERLNISDRSTAWTDAWIAAERHSKQVTANRLEKTAELFEGKVFAELARLVPDEALLYVGNSMPVRDLDGFWPVGSKRVRFLCNRGANGIDGFVSSGLGAAAVTDVPVVMVTGDLGFYHDLNGLMAIKRHNVRATIIVLNNDGGGIFGFLPQSQCGAPFEEFFTTPHGLDFRGVVEMYGARFSRVASWEQFREAVQASIGSDVTGVVEVPVNRTRNLDLHRDIWASIGEALTQAANQEAGGSS